MNIYFCKNILSDHPSPCQSASRPGIGLDPPVDQPKTWWGDQMQIVDFRPEQSLNLLNHKEWTKTTLSLTPEANQDSLDGYSVPYFSWFLGLVVCILYYCFILPPKMSFSRFFIRQGCHMLSQQFLYIMSAKVKKIVLRKLKQQGQEPHPGAQIQNPKY